jgi:hypothetical protein
MENQQVKISWEWLAGFYDGEGCLSLSKGISKGYDTYSAQIDLVNTNFPVMEAIVQFLADHGISVYVNKTKNIGTFHRDANRKHKQRMNVRIARLKNVKLFLAHITPFLILKRRNALLLMEFVNTRATKFIKVSDRDRQIYLELKELTTKGVLIESSEANTPSSES